jgi:hypothetical protein
VQKLTLPVVLIGLLLLLAGCTMVPGGIAPSNTPINGRTYKVIGPADRTDSRVYLLGMLPLTGANTIRDAVEDAIQSRDGDALINVSVESYSQWWVILTRHVTRVQGDVIRFTSAAQ